MKSAAETTSTAKLRAAKAYRGRLLTPLSIAETELRCLEDALLAVGEDGRIVHVGPFDRAAFRGPILDVRPHVLVPGFVDTHVHFPQVRIIGSATGPLLDWLERTVFPEEARFADKAYAEQVAREFVAGLIGVGTTTAAIFSSSDAVATHVLFEALDLSGLRAIGGLTLMDQRCPDELRVAPERAVAACRELIERWHGKDAGRLEFAVTPRFALSCSRDLMERAAELAREHGLLVQTHLAENEAEGRQTLEAHPFGRDYLGVYEQVGLLTGRSLFAHAIHLSSNEWDRIAGAGAAIAHCPDSNFFLGSGRMRFAEASNRRIAVGLGTDVGAGRSLDVRRQIAMAYDTALCVGDSLAPSLLFRTATLGGAEALGLSKVIGSLEVGKDADFNVVRVPSFIESEAELLAHLAFGVEGIRVDRSFVRGKALRRDRFGLPSRSAVR